MKIFKNPEHKGILGLIGIIIVLAVALMMLSGKFTDLTGISLTFKKPLINKIVFVSDRSGHPDVWVMNHDGTSQKALTDNKYKDHDPVISPDGYTVIFVSQQGAAQSQIYAVDADGTHPRRITKITGTKSDPHYSPDGREIMFVSAGEIWQVGRRGEQPARVLPTEQEVAMGRISEEKTPYIWAARSQDEEILAAIHSLGESQVAVRLESGDEVPLPIEGETPDGKIPVNGETISAAWSPDENKLALTLNDREGGAALVIADLDNGSIQPVFVASSSMGKVRWSPDGSLLAIETAKRIGSNDYEPTGLIVFNISDGKLVKTVKEPSTDPVWSPDSKNIAYVRKKDIYSLDVESGKSVNLTKGKGSNWSPYWSTVK